MFGVCNSVKLSRVFVIASYRCPINSVTNANPVTGLPSRDNAQGLKYLKYCCHGFFVKRLKLNSAAISTQAIYNDPRPPLPAKLVLTFLGRRCYVVSATAVNLVFFDRSRYYLFQVAPELSSRGHEAGVRCHHKRHAVA
jgi:hypothetical protein